MSTLELVTGDDASFQVQLTKDEATFIIDSGATVKAAVVSADRKSTILAAVTLDRVVSHPVSGDPLSDWVNSVVYAVFASADTDGIASKWHGKTALLEIQVDDPTNSEGKITWFQKIKILKGNIDQ